MEASVKPDMRFGKMVTMWCWSSKSNGRVWKCKCDCGNKCYIKEEALAEHLAVDCGCVSQQDYAEMIHNG